MQALSIRVAGGDVDFLATDMETAKMLVQSDFFCDLSEKMDAQLFEKLSPYLLYAERSELPVRSSPNAETPPLPNLAKADGMTDPVPVALSLPADSLFASAYNFAEGDVVMLIMHNAPHMEMLALFLDYIMV